MPKSIDFPAVTRYIGNCPKISCTGTARPARMRGEAIPIENEILALYTRCLSELLPFQRAGHVEYVLLGRPAGPLRLVVRAQHDGEEKARVAQCELGGLEEAAARRLLQFLYENAVSAENVCDLVRDLFSAAGAEGTKRDTAALP